MTNIKCEVLESSKWIWIRSYSLCEAAPCSVNESVSFCMFSCLLCSPTVRLFVAVSSSLRTAARFLMTSSCCRFPATWVQQVAASLNAPPGVFTEIPALCCPPTNWRYLINLYKVTNVWTFWFKGEHGVVMCCVPCLCPSHGSSVWLHCQRGRPLWVKPNWPPHQHPCSHPAQKHKRFTEQATQNRRDVKLFHRCPQQTPHSFIVSSWPSYKCRKNPTSLSSNFL